MDKKNNEVRNNNDGSDTIKKWVEAYSRAVREELGIKNFEEREVGSDVMDLIKKVAEIDYYHLGLDPVIKPVEECAEFIEALMCTKTYKKDLLQDDGWEDAFTEAADAIVTILVLAYGKGGAAQIEQISREIVYKLKRTVDRFEKGEPV